MTTIEIHQPQVHLVRAVAGDDTVIQSMLVSTRGEAAQAVADDAANAGRIRFLMRNRHGTPFEHNMFTFFVKAPIVVFREHHRHRIGWSYNEESGRYRQLEPHFYIPPPERPLTQTGKPGAYIMSPGTPDQHALVVELMTRSFQDSYDKYEWLLEAGIAKEVARGVLPVYIMSSMYATANARSMMAFLSLRTDEPESAYPSKPLWEIDRLVARVYEQALAEYMPQTFEAFNEFGRMSP